MLGVVRQFVDSALGALPTERAMDAAAGAVDVVRGVVRSQVRALGIATKEDVDELRERLWRLEGPGEEDALRAEGPKRSVGSARRTTPKRSAPRRSTVKRVPVKGS